jgi:hypothetical protein
MLTKALMAASAAIFLGLGALHFAYTFWWPQLAPRDPALQTMMGNAPLVLTRETTMWRAWLGFNTSHSMGLILFGLVYGYLALMHDELLFRSTYLLIVGLAMVCGFVVSAKLFWFSVPFWGLCAALACFVASIALSRI